MSFLEITVFCIMIQMNSLRKMTRRWVDYAQSQRRLFFKLTEG